MTAQRPTEVPTVCQRCNDPIPDSMVGAFCSATCAHQFHRDSRRVSETPCLGQRAYEEHGRRFAVAFESTADWGVCPVKPWHELDERERGVWNAVVMLIADAVVDAEREGSELHQIAVKPLGLLTEPRSDEPPGGYYGTEGSWVDGANWMCRCSPRSSLSNLRSARHCAICLTDRPRTPRRPTAQDDHWCHACKDNGCSECVDDREKEPAALAQAIVVLSRKGSELHKVAVDLLGLLTGPRRDDAGRATPSEHEPSTGAGNGDTQTSAIGVTAGETVPTPPVAEGFNLLVSWDAYDEIRRERDRAVFARKFVEDAIARLVGCFGEPSIGDLYAREGVSIGHAAILDLRIALANDPVPRRESGPTCLHKDKACPSWEACAHRTAKHSAERAADLERMQYDYAEGRLDEMDERSDELAALRKVAEAARTVIDCRYDGDLLGGRVVTTRAVEALTVLDHALDDLDATDCARVEETEGHGHTIMVGGFAPGNETPNNRAVKIGTGAPVPSAGEAHQGTSRGAGPDAGGTGRAHPHDARVCGKHRAGHSATDAALDPDGGPRTAVDAAKTTGVVTDSSSATPREKHGWAVHHGKTVVECPGCAFTMGIEHEEEGADRLFYDCPNCGDSAAAGPGQK